MSSLIIIFIASAVALYYFVKTELESKDRYIKELEDRLNAKQLEVERVRFELELYKDAIKWKL